jgi:hypothetical protein
VLKRFIQTLAIAASLTLVACNSSNTTTDNSGGGGGGGSTVASFTGTYTGTTTGVNAGPTTLTIAADKSLKGTFSITNRLTNETGTGVPTVYETTLDGSVDSSGKVTFNSFLDGALVMVFTGQINSAGLLTGTYFEPAFPNDPSKAGTFSLQGPKNGTTTAGPTTGGAAKSCTGSYVGNYSAPEQAERREARNRSLAGRGIPVTGNEDIDNANAGGGPPDGGIWMAGSFAFETDANCNIIKGTTLVFYAFEYNISGTIVKSGTSDLTWSGQGSVGQMEVTVDANNKVGGSFRHPAPDTFIRGIIDGTFTPNGKI